MKQLVETASGPQTDLIPSGIEQSSQLDSTLRSQDGQQSRRVTEYTPRESGNAWNYMPINPSGSIQAETSAFSMLNSGRIAEGCSPTASTSTDVQPPPTSEFLDAALARVRCSTLASIFDFSSSLCNLIFRSRNSELPYSGFEYQRCCYFDRLGAGASLMSLLSMSSVGGDRCFV